MYTIQHKPSRNWRLCRVGNGWVGCNELTPLRKSSHALTIAGSRYAYDVEDFVKRRTKIAQYTWWLNKG